MKLNAGQDKRRANPTILYRVTDSRLRGNDIEGEVLAMRENICEALTIFARQAITHVAASTDEKIFTGLAGLSGTTG